MISLTANRTITISVANPASQGDPVTVYQGQPAQLIIVLTNATEEDIGLTAASTLEVYLPQFYTAAQIGQTTIGGISVPGWSAKFNRDGPSWVLSWTQPPGIWERGNTLGFTISNLTTSAAPQIDSVQVNFNCLTGVNIPLQVSSPIVLMALPVPGNANLRDILDVQVEHGGAVYVSEGNVPLENTVFLNLKNLGRTPLYSGTGKNLGAPTVTVSFVYGTTSGSLAPAEKAHAAEPGSAWTIVGSVAIDQTAKWLVQNPRLTDQSNTPAWLLKPVSTNREVIGVGDRANVTFAFSNIISFTPPGPTQMMVQFSGFTKDDNTVYENTVFVVGLNKQTAPNPGAISIYSRATTIKVSSDTAPVSIPLSWTMFGVGSVRLSFFIPDVPNIPEVKYGYGTARSLLSYDQQTPQIAGIKDTQMLTIYLSAYADQTWQRLLNKIECTVPLLFPPVINSFTIAPAPIAPPHSSAFLLTWNIAGATGIQITADDGTGPQTLPVPQTATKFTVHPIAPKTAYTLTVFGNAVQPQ